MQHPIVLLVGRTNVGKSTLFNRLATKNKSIVFDQEGVTRDYVEEIITWNDKTFKLLDTGGLSFKKGSAEIEKKVQEKVQALLNKASVILFVCDIKNGLTQEDLQIGNVLRKIKKPIFLVLNKADNSKVIEENSPDFYKLGFSEIIPASGIHGTGIGTILNTIVNTIPQPKSQEIETPQYNIVIVGKPNVGKSSLMNLLIKQERSIVSPISGTTREAISENIYHCSDLLQITDTPGVRRKSRIDEDLEELMVKSSLNAVKQADFVLLMIDASEGKLADQELKLLFYAYELRKPLIILFNKSDLLVNDLYAKDRLQQSSAEYDFILKKIPQITLSCLTKKNVNKILDQVKKVIERCHQEFNPVELLEIVRNQLDKKPLFHKKIPLKIFTIKHIKQASIPTFLLLVNYPQWFGPTQLGFIENVLRKHYDLKGCPIRFDVQTT